MNGKDAIFYVLNRIQDARQTTSAGKPVSISPIHEFRQFPRHLFENILEKLEKDEKILLVIDQPSPNTSWYVTRNRAYYTLKILPEFDIYLKNLQSDPDYQNYMGITPNAATSTQPNSERSTATNVPQFDEEFSTIVFMNKNIKIKPGTLNRSLCALIFKNNRSLHKTWNNDGLADALDESDTNIGHRYYNAAGQINTKVAKKVHIEDLLIADMKSVKVNPQYL